MVIKVKDLLPNSSLVSACFDLKQNMVKNFKLHNKYVYLLFIIC